MGPKVLECISQDCPIADLFWTWCEFGALEEDAPDWFALASQEPLQVVGKDGSGGRFCLFPASNDFSGRLLFVDSEGHAGVIADSLSDGIRLMIALPNWHDCLKFSGGGKLEEMKKAQVCLEADLRQHHPDLETTRGTLYRAFKLTEMPMPLETLHRVVSEGAETKVVVTEDGRQFDGLFNTFVVEDCPTWKDQF